MTDDKQRGGAFYDDQRVLDEYLTHRHAAVRSPNLVMEEPAFLHEAGDLAGLRILDLGCGDGSFGLTAYNRGCAGYVGVDGSSMMVEQARRLLTKTPAKILHQDIEDLDLDHDLSPDHRFDLVASRMALHYVDDVSRVFSQVRTLLAPGGRFVMSVVHPVITSHDNEQAGRRTSWTVDRYFDSGPRRRDWFGATVTWYHRPIEAYVTELSDAGLKLVALREAAPVPELFGDNTEELERRRRVPLFLVLRATL